MKIIRNEERIAPPVAATIGMFDGVHAGHRSVLGYLQSEAASDGMSSAVITFARHPRTVLHPDEPVALLTSLDDRLTAIGQAGMDYVVVLDFDARMAQLSAREFLALIAARYGVRKLLAGYDHRFGHNRIEMFDDYVRYGHELGMRVKRLPELLSPMGRVSSSEIRKLLAEGNVDRAALLLTRPYGFVGTVVHGFENGRKMGYPTANIVPDEPDLAIPARGVYAVRVNLQGDWWYGGMLNIGIRPTFGGTTEETIEANIFGFDGDLYGQKLRVEFVGRLRGERRMSSVAELAAQLAADRDAAEKILKNNEI